MFKTLLVKELRNVFASPKFTATFAVCSVLILLAIATGYSQYRSFERQQSTLRELTNQELSEQTRWFGLSQRALRPTDPLQVFATGSHQDIGRYSAIHANQDVDLRNSVYEENSILAVFRHLDLTYVIQVVLTLFALIFTYDAISGERESGVLRLVAAHAVPRSRYIGAKILGSILGLGVPLLIPLLLGLLILMLLGVPLASDTALRLGLFLGASALLFVFFIVFGVLVSTSTRHSSSSFLVGLSAWVLMVLIVPRLGVLTAAEIAPVPSPAEIASQKDGFAREANASLEQGRQAAWADRMQQFEGLDEASRQAIEDENMWTWMQEDDEARREVQEEIAALGGQLEEGLRNQQRRQEAIALGLSRWSPPSAFRSVVMRLAQTHVDLAERSENSMRQYREQFRNYQLEKDPAGGAMTIRSNGDRETSSGDSGSDRLDLSDMPLFQPPKPDLPAILAATLPDITLLLVMTLLCYGLAVYRFAHYDPR